MRTVNQWLRERPVAADGLLVALLLALDALTLTRLPMSTSAAGAVLLVGLGLGQLVPLALRRRAPRTVAAVVLAVFVLQVGLQPETTPRLASVAVQLALFTLVSRGDRRAGLVVVAGVLSATTVSVLARGEPLGALLVPALVVSLAWFVAELAAARRAYDAEVAARVVAAEADRDRLAAEAVSTAVAAERARIARELHDVVAHAVSVMVVQADGASLALPADTAVATRSLETIADTGRQALAELRRTLALVRGPGTGTDLTPVPGAEGLRELVARVQAVGLPVGLHVDGDVDGLPAGIGLGVHRIVQESLTNVLRHAGPGAAAEVRVHRHPGHVEVSVSDHGGTRAPVVGHRPGHGLLGMRERVAVLDGTLHAGPLPTDPVPMNPVPTGPDAVAGATGGWRVLAILPLA